MLFRSVDDMGEHSGDNIAYIYPDNHTALVGQFTAGEFVRYLQQMLQCNI